MIPRPEIISHTLHRSLTWRFDPAPKPLERQYFPLAIDDLRHCAFVSPIGFMSVGRDLAPVLLSDPAFNRVSDPNERWALKRLPWELALYPFCLVYHAGREEPLLAFARDDMVIGADYENQVFGRKRLTPRMRNIMQRLVTIESSRTKLKELAQTLASRDLLTALPEHDEQSGRRKVQVIRADQLHTLADEPDPQGYLRRLAYAAAFSLHQLPARILRAVDGYVGPITESPSSEAAAPLPEPVENQMGYLFDEEATLTFNFTARGSVFKSG